MPESNFEKHIAQESESVGQELYSNPNTEQKKLNSVYSVVQELYKQTMFEAPSQWVGYNSGLGFDIPAEIFGFHEPSLQRILSLLHIELSQKKIDLEQTKDQLAIVIAALNKFDPEKDLTEGVKKDFYESDALAHINKVKAELTRALQAIS